MITDTQAEPVYADVRCPYCNKRQPVMVESNARVWGKCIRSDCRRIYRIQAMTETGKDG